MLYIYILYIYNCMQIYITGCIFLQSKKTGMMPCSYPLFDCRYPHWYPLIPFITFHDPLTCILPVQKNCCPDSAASKISYIWAIKTQIYSHANSLLYIYTCWLCSYTYTHVHVCIYTNTLKKKISKRFYMSRYIYIYIQYTYIQTWHDMAWHGMAFPYFTLHYIALHM